MRPFTLIDEGRPMELSVDTADGAIRLAPAVVESALGWMVTREGLCRGAECAPWPPGAQPAPGEGVSLAVLAQGLGRRLAVDVDGTVAYLGGSAPHRAATLRTLVAPDFTLADLGGRLHSLRDQRGRKVLIVAWASW